MFTRIAVGSAVILAGTGCDNGSPSPVKGSPASGGHSIGAGSGGAPTGAAGPSGGSNGSNGAGGAGGTLGGFGGATDAAWLAPPVVPDAIKAPAGATVALHLHATGAQVYTCTATPSAGIGGAGGAAPGAGASGVGGEGAGGTTQYAWILKAPDAHLFDQAGTDVGTHSAGPTWSSAADGSSVVGMKVEQANAPLADAIPWLLLRAVSTAGTGVFSNVTFIQRVDTMKGKAPTTGCGPATGATDARVDYSAEYFFYQGGASVSEDGGTDASGG